MYNEEIEDESGKLKEVKCELSNSRFLPKNIKGSDALPKTVLMCPLDWGLGHASRDVELISNYIQQGYNVIIAADKAPLQFLRQHYPNLPYVVFKGVSIRYSRLLPFKLKMLLSLPKILYGIHKEHRQLKKIIEKYDIDIVVSDNRYGLWNKNVHSIFITHQLWVRVSKVALIEKFANYINHRFIKQYSRCLVPDYERVSSVAGLLSHPINKPTNVQYIGLLSRFKDTVEYEKEAEKKYFTSENYDILAILSGPEPQRSIFEKIIIREVADTNYKTLIVQGKPEKIQQNSRNNITFVNHVDSCNLCKLIQNIDIIICRSGYSSIMDLQVLNKKAIIIPTPGQSEQEYLSKYLSEKNLFVTCKQNQFKLQKMIIKLRQIQNIS